MFTVDNFVGPFTNLIYSIRSYMHGYGTFTFVSFTATALK